MSFIPCVIMLAAICQDAAADSEEKFVEEAKAAQRALIEKGAITSGILFNYRNQFFEGEVPPTRPGLSQLDFFSDSSVQGSDLKVLDRFLFIQGIQIYNRRFVDSDFEVLRRLAGTVRKSKSQAESGRLYGTTNSFTLHSDTVTDSVLQHVAALKYLQTLDLEGQYSVDALTALADLKDLKSLTIRSVSPRNLNTTEYGRYDSNLQRSWKQPVKFPPSLKSLNLVDLALTDDDLAGLARLIGLQGLRLDGSLIRGPGLAHLEGLPIRGLSLVRCALCDDALDNLRGLPIAGLSLIQCGLRDDDLDHLPVFPMLSSQYSILSLSHNDLTDAVIEKLPDNVPHLILSHNPITGETAANWKRFRNIISLDLSSTLVDDTIFSQFVGSAELRRLDLRRTRVTAEGIKVLVGTSIESLTLDYCPVTSDGLNEICQLKQLKSLDLNGIRLTTGQLEMIGHALPKLIYLSVIGCGLTDDQIESFRRDPTLSHVESLHTKFEPMQPIKVGFEHPPAGGSFRELSDFPKPKPVE